MLHFDDIVFGPIYSRRLGLSLGVNILPSKGKLCNFDCVYCECGWNKDGTDPARRFPTFEEVKDALTEKIATAAKDGLGVDSITFSGNGEPTMHPDFARIIDITLNLREEYFPNAKVSVLSNATLLDREDVLNALMKIDNPIMKIDASSQHLIEKINKPVGAYSLDSVLQNLKKFNGNFILQTMFLKSQEFDTVSQDALNAWMNIVRKLEPRQVMVYTIDRETPDKTLMKYSVEQMTAMVQPLIDEGFDIQVRG